MSINNKYHQLNFISKNLYHKLKYLLCENKFKYYNKYLYLYNYIFQKIHKNSNMKQFHFEKLITYQKYKSIQSKKVF